MFKIVFISILFSLWGTISCSQVREGEIAEVDTMKDEVESDFDKIAKEIRDSDIYENPDNWDARGLIPSERSEILILRNATNDFLDKLEMIYKSNESREDKLKEISKIVDDLPWEKLDREEKDFMADVLVPAIQAAGFDPWKIF